jgi:hypothetical protein
MLVARTRALEALVRALAGAPERPAWSDEPTWAPKELEDLVEIVKSIEPVETQRGFSDSVRFLRKSFLAQAEAIAARGRMTKGERAAVRVMTHEMWATLEAVGRK